MNEVFKIETRITSSITLMGILLSELTNPENHIAPLNHHASPNFYKRLSDCLSHQTFDKNKSYQITAFISAVDLTLKFHTSETYVSTLKIKF